jgi:hypothetical protein
MPTVTRRHLIPADLVLSQASYMAFVVDKLEQGKVFLRVLKIPLPIITPPNSIFSRLLFGTGATRPHTKWQGIHSEPAPGKR